MKKSFYIFIVILSLLLLLTPFLMLLGPNKLRYYANKELIYKVITDKLTEDSISKKEKAITLFKYLHYHLYAQGNPADVDQLHHLIRNVAWCDSQAGTLVALARKIGLKGGWVGLRGFDEISGHSVAVLYIDGKYRMFDPMMGYLYLDQDDNIATLEDIQNNYDLLKSEQSEAMKMIESERLNKVKVYGGIDRLESYRTYRKLYEPKHSWEIHILTWPGFERKIISKIIDSYYEVFGDAFLILFQELYFKVASIDPFLRARMKHLSFRFKSAINDYDNLLLDKDSVIKTEVLSLDFNTLSDEIISSEIMFFKGLALWDMKDFNRCIETYISLLKAYPNTRWIGPIYFYLGNCYENLHDMDKAKEMYKIIITDSKFLIESTPAAIHLMHLNKIEERS